MIIVCDLMAPLGFLYNCKRQFLQWDGIKVTMKEPSGMLYQINLTSREMHEVSIQTSKPDSTRKATERLVKTVDSIYAKTELEKIATNATHLNEEEINRLLRLLQYSEDFFDGAL